MTNNSSLYSIMHARDTTLHIQQHIIRAKTYIKFQPDWLVFSRKGYKNAKNAYFMHNLCIPKIPSSLIRCTSPY